MIARIGMLIGLAVCLAGCFAPSRTRIIDVAPRSGTPTVKKVSAEGDVLRVEVVQDGGVVFVAAIEPKLIEGDVYLSKICISSVVHATEFSVDFSSARFPRDWKQRLYWIEEDSISSPINPLIEHVREIRRSKITVE